MYIETLSAILLPFLGTTIGAACVFFVKEKMNRSLQRSLTGFASGVMVAASIWSLIIPAMDQSQHLGKLAFLPAFIGVWGGFLFLLLLDQLIPPPAPEQRIPRGQSQQSGQVHYDGAGGGAAQSTGGHGGWSGHRRMACGQ